MKTCKDCGTGNSDENFCCRECALPFYDQGTWVCTECPSCCKVQLTNHYDRKPQVCLENGLKEDANWVKLS